MIHIALGSIYGFIHSWEFLLHISYSQVKTMTVKATSIWLDT